MTPTKRVSGNRKLHNGLVEPHAELLNQPLPDQLLYKVMSVENLLYSIDRAYLYFNRVDSYTDGPNADPDDGKQLPSDQPGNANTQLVNSPTFSAADHYNQSRGRTYACCFSLENSKFIWENYGGGGMKGKVCAVFRFDKLREKINDALGSGNCFMEYQGERCDQIFSVNYGMVQYVERRVHQANGTKLPNPIEYSYMKDVKFNAEKEFRITLSAFGMGKFVLGNDVQMQFPRGLSLSFDFRAAKSDQTIQDILCGPDVGRGYFERKLAENKIEVVWDDKG